MPYMLGFLGRRMPTSLGSGVIITGMWWTRRSGGCLLTSDWMMPPKQMSIWGIESAQDVLNDIVQLGQWIWAYLRWVRILTANTSYLSSTILSCLIRIICLLDRIDSSKTTSGVHAELILETLAWACLSQNFGFYCFLEWSWCHRRDFVPVGTLQMISRLHWERNFEKILDNIELETVPTLLYTGGWRQGLPTVLRVVTLHEMQVGSE
jgi:hypothetical protein